MKLKQKLHSILYTDFTPQELARIGEAINKDNFYTLSLLSRLGCICFFVFILITYIFPDYASERPYYIFTVLVFLFFIIATHLSQNGKYFNSKLLRLSFIIFVLLDALYLDLFLAAEEMCVYLPVLFILLPIAFTERPYFFITVYVLTYLCYYPIAPFTKPSVILLFDGVNVIIYSFIGLVTNHYLIRIKLERLIYFANKEDMASKELELLRLQALISQIQPHFIFNSLTTIIALCDINPAQAKEVTLNFADYLRSNLDAKASYDLIPFSQELKHVKAYLNIETVRFAEYLRVKYDIQEDSFLVPALTLEPLVENAVKHGLGNRIQGGNIIICSRKTEGGYYFAVEDDGDGFDPSTALNEPGHYGLKNTRERLLKQCGGILKIISSPGRGAKIEVFIPAP